MTDTIANPASLSAALKEASGGDVIRLAPGDYPQARPSRGLAKPSGPITITADDPASPPRFTEGLTLDNPQSLRFVGLDYDITSATAASAAAVRVYGGSDLEFVGGRYRGRLIEATGQRWGQALNATGVAGLSIVRPDIDTVYRGLVLGGCVDVLIDEADIHRLGSNGVNFGQCKRVILRRSQLVDFAPYGLDHPDGVQIMTGQSGEASEDILIEDCLIVCGLGPRAQGVFARTENTKVRHQRITVRGNTIVNNGNHGVTLGGSNDILVEDNALLFQLIPPEFQPKGGFSNSSWIKTDEATGIVRRNRAMRFIGPQANADAENVTIPAATQAEVEAAIAVWRKTYRAAPSNPVPEAPARDELREILVARTGAKLEPLKTKGRLIVDFKTPAEGVAALAAVNALT